MCWDVPEVIFHPTCPIVSSSTACKTYDSAIHRSHLYLWFQSLEPGSMPGTYAIGGYAHGPFLSRSVPIVLGKRMMTRREMNVSPSP